MPVDPAKLRLIDAEIQVAATLAPYQAANGLWVCLVKFANLLPTVGEEHEQVASLLRHFTRQQAESVVADVGVDRLLDLKPSLETVLADERERLHQLPSAREIARVRERRARDPKAALAALFQILQRIRDKREHAFKYPSDPRDSEILQATSSILHRLCEVVVQHLSAASSVRTGHE